jgi:hypothetical protein
MTRPVVAFLTQLLLAIRSRFTRRAHLEAENLVLRQQLVVSSQNLIRANEDAKGRRECSRGGLIEFEMSAPYHEPA